MDQKTLIRTVLGLALVLVLGVGAYIRSGQVMHPEILGQTMGTTYSVKVTGKLWRKDLALLTQQIESELLEINRQMSTWDEKSEISCFNASQKKGPHQISESFASVIKRSLELSHLSNGAFDPTLQPLLNLWGFGSEGKTRKKPSRFRIRKVRKRVGYKKVRIDESSDLWKDHVDLELDLSAIAKGYGVDCLARILNDSGCKNWFVEIGGEVAVKGINPERKPWKIGIQYPSTYPMDQRLQGIVHLSNDAVATSGDYRNYIITDKDVYSHILDPRTGRAVSSRIASVTVIAPDCTDADGMATALFVMGAKDGLVWVEKQENVEALFLIRNDNNEILEKFSSGFIAATRYSPGSSISKKKEP